MVRRRLCCRVEAAIVSTTARQRGKQRRANHASVRSTCSAHPPEKPKACASEPKPPRVTWPDPESDVVPNADLPDQESPPKKLLREDDPPPPPWLPEDDPRGGHSALPCNSDGDDG
jgi:hypothetical protein